MRPNRATGRGFTPPRLMVSLYQEIANFFKDYYQTNI